MLTPAEDYGGQLVAERKPTSPLASRLTEVAARVQYINGQVDRLVGTLEV